ncbi:MAG: zinc ribbon domain-containing protein, partial [Planctomycetota bacterium]|nr:zinc ribbon domain-containing protein [Planctomycetota bacterium]
MEHESTRQCPNCEAQINDDAVLCIQCGFNVRTEEGIPAEFNFKETGSANSVDVGGWIALAIGLALALSVSFIPLLGPTLSSLTILVHEIGHAATSWLFGYPAIPAFDFSHGGGISSHFGRSTFILIILLLAQVGLIFAARKSKRLMGTAIGLSVLWALAAF